VWEEVIISVGPAPDKREWRQVGGCSPNGTFTSQFITAQPGLYSSRIIANVKE